MGGHLAAKRSSAELTDTMVTECCLSGFQWDGTPLGVEGKIANNKAYVVGGNEKVAILVVAGMYLSVPPVLRLN